MAYVITNASTLSCATQGTVSPSSSKKLKVNGSPVVTTSDLENKSVIGCTNQTSSTTKCSKITTVTSPSTKLKAGGESVVLTSSSMSTDGTDSTILTKTAGHSKLKA